MKKAIAIFAIAALTACGSNNAVVVNADSTAVAAVTDTTVKADSTVAPVEAKKDAVEAVK